MADKMRMYLELLGKNDSLRRSLSDSGRAVHGFAAKAKNELAAIGRAASSFQGKLAALGVSVGAGMVLRDSAKLDKSLTQIGQTASAGKEKMQAMRSEFFRMGKDSGQEIEGLKQGFSTLVAGGLDLNESISSLDAINKGMAVTGAKADVLASALGVASANFGFDLAKQGQALELLDKMTAAGRAGKLELEQLASIFSKLGPHAVSAGMSMEKTLAMTEALSLRNPEADTLGTLVESTLRIFNNRDYLKQIEKTGRIKFFDKDDAMRQVDDILADIKKRFDRYKTDKQQLDFLGKVFKGMDQTTLTGVKMLLTGNTLEKWSEFEKEDIQKGKGVINQDFPEAVNNAEDQSGRLKNTLREAADKFAQPVNKALADLIQKGLNPKEQGGLGLTGEDLILGGGAAAIGGTLLARLGANALGGLAGKLLKEKGGTVTGVMEGMAWEKMAGVTPVFVTNWPGEMGQVKVPNVPGVDKKTLETLKDSGAKAKGFLNSLAKFVPPIPSIGAALSVGIPLSVGRHFSEKNNEELLGRSTEDLQKEKARLENIETDWSVGGSYDTAFLGSINMELVRRLEATGAATAEMAARIGASVRSDIMAGADTGDNQGAQGLRGYRPQESVFDNQASASIQNFLAKLQATGMAERIKEPLQRDIMMGADSGGDQAAQAFQGSIAQFAADIIRGDNELAQRIADIEHKVENNVTLNIRVDQAGRVTTETGNLNTKATVNVQRGEF